MGHAVDLWHRRMCEEWGDDYECTDEPDQCACIADGPVEIDQPRCDDCEVVRACREYREAVDRLESYAAAKAVGANTPPTTTAAELSEDAENKRATMFDALDRVVALPTADGPTGALIEAAKDVCRQFHGATDIGEVRSRSVRRLREAMGDRA